MNKKTDEDKKTNTNESVTRWAKLLIEKQTDIAFISAFKRAFNLIGNDENFLSPPFKYIYHTINDEKMVDFCLLTGHIMSLMRKSSDISFIDCCKKISPKYPTIEKKIEAIMKCNSLEQASMAIMSLVRILKANKLFFDFNSFVEDLYYLFCNKNYQKKEWARQFWANENTKD